MQKIKLKTEESGKKLLEAYAPPKWSETADDDEPDPTTDWFIRPCQTRGLVSLGNAIT